MRNWITAIAELFEGFGVGQKILITDLYDNYELMDESELISQYAPPTDWDIPLTIRVMSPEQAREVKTIYGNTVLNAYEIDASKQQKNIVARKVKNYDRNRVIVTCSNTIVDGNHQIIAAILTNNPVLYVDLDEWP